MERFFILVTSKPSATDGMRLAHGFMNIALIHAQLITLFAMVGFGFRLGFGS